MASPKIASGHTTPDDWQQYLPENSGIFVDVDTSAAEFSTTPVYVTSLGGYTGHWFTTGATSIYVSPVHQNDLKLGFRVYVRLANGATLTPDTAKKDGWYINWLGIES